ncbi:MAG: MMPL family transporter [Spirochaetales bacterium]|nr:MMPL family transporter [Spirochaetales bacterium]
MRGLKQKFFAGWAGWSTDNPWKAFLIVLAVTVVLSFGYSFLKMEMTFYSMMPQSSSQVRDMKNITENFAFSSQIGVIVDARNIEDQEEAERKVVALIQRLQAEFTSVKYAEQIEGVTAGMDREFLRNHMMMLIKAEDQERFADLYRDINLVPYLTGLNDDYEGEYSGNDENLEDDESMVDAQFRGLERILGQLGASVAGAKIDSAELEAGMDEYLFGETWFLSRDNRMGGLYIRPTFNFNDFKKYPLIQGWDDTAQAIAAEYGIGVGLTGMMVVAKDEMASSEEGLVVSMLVAFILVIGLMILAFRMKSVPFIVGVPLLLGIVWAIGLTGFIVQRLNIVTAMYMVALIGLGVDYAVHILAAYVQERADGLPFRQAMVNSMMISGPGILVGGLTTAAAFLALSTAKTELVSELGMVAGLGILCELAAMLLIIPPVLALRQRRLERRGKVDRLDGRKQNIRSSLTGGLGRFVSRRPGMTVLIFAVLGAMISTQAGKVSVEDNLMNMEAKGLKSVELQDTMVEEFGMAPDGLYVVTNDPLEAAELTDRLEDLDSVKAVESISLWLPSDDQYNERKPLVEKFARDLLRLPEAEEPDLWAFLDELFRLESNLIEMGDMAYLGQMERLTNTLNTLTGLNEEGRKVNESLFDRIAAAVEANGEDETFMGLRAFQDEFRPLLKERLLSMTNTGKITRDELPAMARESYISRDGEYFLLSIVPRQNPWNGEFRNIFTSQIASVTERATGMILVSDQLVGMAAKDGVRATFLSLIIVFLILLIDFRNFKLSIMTFIPLLFSIGTLLGFMSLFNIKFDFLNIIAIPLLIGIGIDDAVHINHRYRIEGAGGMERVITKTGTAVFMTTVTTVIGFASFIPSIMQAMKGTGIVLSLAMILTFIFSVFLHPALLVLVRERLNLSIEPWGSKGKITEDKE